MLLLIVAINVDKLESKALLHYVKYCPHMNSKFDYGKIDSILMTSLRYTYSIYNHCLANVAKRIVAVNMILTDSMLMITSCFKKLLSLEFCSV